MSAFERFLSCSSCTRCDDDLEEVEELIILHPRRPITQNFEQLDAAISQQIDDDPDGEAVLAASPVLTLRDEDDPFNHFVSVASEESLPIPPGGRGALMPAAAAGGGAMQRARAGGYGQVRNRLVSPSLPPLFEDDEGSVGGDDVVNSPSRAQTAGFHWPHPNPNPQAPSRNGVGGMATGGGPQRQTGARQTEGALGGGNEEDRERSGGTPRTSAALRLMQRGVDIRLLWPPGSLSVEDAKKRLRTFPHSSDGNSARASAVESSSTWDASLQILQASKDSRALSIFPRKSSGGGRETPRQSLSVTGGVSSVSQQGGGRGGQPPVGGGDIPAPPNNLLFPLLRVAAAHGTAGTQLPPPQRSGAEGAGGFLQSYTPRGQTPRGSGRQNSALSPEPPPPSGVLWSLLIAPSSSSSSSLTITQINRTPTPPTAQLQPGVSQATIEGATPNYPLQNGGDSSPGVPISPTHQRPSSGPPVHPDNRLSLGEGGETETAAVTGSVASAPDAGKPKGRAASWKEYWLWVQGGRDSESFARCMRYLCPAGRFAVEPLDF
uniref:Uncharacterized protein n=1 Tax=Chromera velia CCMP2878 TaxID=1169474 RepID=A0A0G4I5G0_9ALVE|eukprot:Cvel_11093.t1-p1 / transcript=Cvel_11093.t1 / gene=Cvel_11093 / organism=Chromera_velia_CCMP2878 / gene_product=hypothetical protein / transcript_product=hypothetical protein / location=Cvel_scaffold686:57661-61060(+) / protein_length=548 / sequence_SO=supercontig / SO=protein_coding / is_pseudo=false